MWLFSAFVAIPIIEIGLFLKLGSLVGVWLTLVIVVLTALLGTVLVRTQGVVALQNLQSSFSKMENPAEPLAHGAMILVSGVLLLTPGFLTDTVGFLLLIPAVRTMVFSYMRNKIKARQFHMGPKPGSSGPGFSGDSPKNEKHATISADYKDITPHKPRKEPSGWTKH